jgi:hypothetical protein
VSPPDKRSDEPVSASMNCCPHTKFQQLQPTNVTSPILELNQIHSQLVPWRYKIRNVDTD